MLKKYIIFAVLLIFGFFGFKGFGRLAFSQKEIKKVSNSLFGN